MKKAAVLPLRFYFSNLTICNVPPSLPTLQLWHISSIATEECRLKTLHDTAAPSFPVDTFAAF